MVATDGTRIADYRPWMEAELASDNGASAPSGGSCARAWHGNTVHALALTGAAAADYVKTV